MKDYALVVAYSKAYLPALCGLLNALDYYEHDLDFHLLYYSDMEDKVDALLKAGLNFRIIPVKADDLFNPAQGIYMNLMFVKYNYIEHLQKYKAVCHLDGDVLLVDNLTPYFKIAAETELIPCAEFPHTDIDLLYYRKFDQDWVQRMFPLANFPIFYNPARCYDLMRECWENMPGPDNDDRERNNEMYVFNKAVYDTGKLPYILPLPGNPWVGDKYVGFEPLSISFQSGKLQIRDFIGDRVHLIHNKYWKEGVSEVQLERSAGNSNVIHNLAVFKQATDFFNNEWKLKLKDLE